MHGPGHRPLNSRSNPAALITLRVVFTVLALCTCGLLSWAATLRIAILRKRAPDWLLFGVVLVVELATLIALGEFGAPPSEDPNAEAEFNAVDYVCLTTLFALSVGSATHFLIADIRHFRRRPEPEPVWSPSHSVTTVQQPHRYRGSGRRPAAPYDAPPGAGYGFPPMQQQPVQAQPVQQQPVQALPVQQQPMQQPVQQQSVRPGPARPPVQPQPRIDQVRAELDELSELLRKEPKDGDGGQGR